ncbi:unnamed protein product [Gongylonema pulchrum]|uniref:Transposase n=1 Tax=Gongylonema pulchrum TaxID=637853 RepID=A0A183DDP6_9BILA|nr:unnamed protein product [Gongylonema pulchrum]
MSNIENADSEFCKLQNSPKTRNISSVSVRNKDEFDYLKQTHLYYDNLEKKKHNTPLLIGLTYRNGELTWDDGRAFDHHGFFAKLINTNFHDLDCRRYLLYRVPRS